MFSWTLALRASYFSKTWLNSRRVTAIIPPSTATRKTTAMRNIRLTRGLMARHMA